MNKLKTEIKNLPDYNNNTYQKTVHHFASFYDALGWVYQQEKYNDWQKRNHAARLYCDFDYTKLGENISSLLGYDLEVTFNVTIEDLRRYAVKCVMRQAKTIITKDVAKNIISKWSDKQVVEFYA